jgi:hypothetical protein
MASMGGFAGQDRSRELAVHQVNMQFATQLDAAYPAALPLPVAAGVWPKDAVDGLGPAGWSWGDTTGGEWLTIPGSAHTRPRLGASPGSAYLLGGRQEQMNTVCALVVPVAHSGVSSGRAYRILRAAELRPVKLDAVLAYEDQEEDAGTLAADDRLSCHTCKDWAVGEHTALGSAHWKRLEAAARVSYERNMASLAKLVDGDTDK